MADIVDPTPASDIVGAGISIARGDYWGAALSTASMVPYLGDAVAKPVKAVRATKAIAGLKTKVAALTKVVNDLKKAKKEAEAVAAAKQAKIAKEADVAKDGAAKQEKAAAKKEKDCEDCGSTEANTTAKAPSLIDSLAAKYAEARNSGTFLLGKDLQMKPELIPPLSIEAPSPLFVIVPKNWLSFREHPLTQTALPTSAVGKQKL